MGIDFKKLIPSNLRTGRWGELIEVIQSVFEEIKADKIDIIKTQFEIDNMSDDEILDFAKFLGYNINYKDGYTSTTYYLKKQLQTIVSRILNRTTRNGYKNIFNIYNLTGEVYPCYIDTDNYYKPLTTWWASNESDTPIIMDREADNILYYNADGSYEYEPPLETELSAIYLDPDPGETPTTLDENSTLSSITRHILVTYKFNFIESVDEFISFNTVESFYDDLWYNKKRTEILHLEPEIEIETNSGSITKTLYTNYDESASGYVVSKIQDYGYGIDFNSGYITAIEVGNSSIDDTTLENTTVSGVDNLVQSYNVSDFNILSIGKNNLNIREPINKTSQFYNFSEIAILGNINQDQDAFAYYSTLENWSSSITNPDEILDGYTATIDHNIFAGSNPAEKITYPMKFNNGIAYYNSGVAKTDQGADSLIKPFGNTSYNWRQGTISAWLYFWGTNTVWFNYCSDQLVIGCGIDHVANTNEVWTYPLDVSVSGVPNSDFFYYRMNLRKSYTNENSTQEFYLNGTQISGSVNFNDDNIYHLFMLWDDSGISGSANTFEIYLDNQKQFETTATIPNSTSEILTIRLDSYDAANINLKHGIAFDNIKIFDSCQNILAEEWNGGSGVLKGTYYTPRRTNTCMYYAKFPEINYSEKFFSGAQFDISVV